MRYSNGHGVWYLVKTDFGYRFSHVEPDEDTPVPNHREVGEGYRGLPYLKRSKISRCNKCDIELKAGENWFEKSKDGYDYIYMRCYRDRSKKWRDDNPEYGKLYYLDNKPRFKERARNGHLSREYGVSPEEVQSIYCEQSGLCILCKKPLDGKFVIEHNHETEKIRGLAHRKCNIAITWFGEDPAIFEEIAQSLRGDNYKSGETP